MAEDEKELKKQKKEERRKARRFPGIKKRLFKYMVTYTEPGWGAVRGYRLLSTEAEKLCVREAKQDAPSSSRALGTSGSTQLPKVRAGPSVCLIWAWGQQTFI